MDASVREVHSVAGEVSDHPVESGIDIVDNYRVLPRLLEVEAVITDTPLAVGLPGASLITSAAAVINGDEKPSVNAWQELQRYFDQAVVLTIETSLQTYDNMVLTSLDITRDASTANGLHFTFSAREVLFATTEEGAAISKIVTGQAKKSAGKATNTAAKAPEAERASFLHNVLH